MVPVVQAFELRLPRIIFGKGTINQIPEIGRELGIHNCLLIVGMTSIQKSGKLETIQESFSRAGCDITLHSGVPAEPTVQAVDEVVKTGIRDGCNGVVSIGGGSVIDVGKAAAIAITNGGSIIPFYRGEKEFANRPLPFISSPTTAGSGAEVTKNSVLRDEELGVKKSVRHEWMRPSIAIIDPELTQNLPPFQTAASGGDALVQALEAYITKEPNPLVDPLALKSIDLLYNHLPRAVSMGDDQDTRNNVALGSLFSAIAFSNAGLGAVHGMAHPVGYAFDLPHGLLCSVLAPHVIDANLEI